MADPSPGGAPSPAPTASPDLYPPADGPARDALLAFIRDTPMAFGTWRGLKGLYKRAESDPDADPALLGALLGRLDAAPLTVPRTGPATLEVPAVRGVAALAADDRRAYVLGSRRGWGGADRLAVLDLDTADPLKPKTLGTAEVAGGVSVHPCGPHVCVLSGPVYGGGGAASAASALNVFTLDDAGRPVGRGRLDLGAPTAMAACVFPYAFVSVQDAAAAGPHQQQRQRKFNGLRIVDLSDPDRPHVVGEIEIKGAMGVAVTEDTFLACVAVPKIGFGWTNLPRSGGLRLVRVADPARPQQVGSIDVGDLRSGTVAGRFAYVGLAQGGTNEPAGLQVIDLSDPSRPRKAGFCATERTPIALAHRGNFVVAALEYGGLCVLDVRDPAAPRAAGRGGAGYPGQVALGPGDLAYVAPAYGGGAIEVWNVGNPAKPARVGTPPSPDTMAYMKRRARRRLRDLARRAPDRYVALAFETLAASGKGTDAVDPRRQWVAMDILFGGSARFRQTRHGRGAYVEEPGGAAAAPRLRLRTREERAPDAWSARPDLAAALVAGADLPWQTRETALKILRAAGLPLPDLSDDALVSLLGAPSPLLVRAASRRVAERMAAGAAVSPVAAADAYVLAGVGRRRVIEEALAGGGGSYQRSGWRPKFAGRVVSGVGRSVVNGAITRRQAGALALIARRMPDAVTPEKVRPLLAPALAARRADLTVWLHDVLRALPVQAALPALRDLEPLPDDLRRPALDALVEGANGKGFPLQTAREGIEAGSEWVRAAAWELLAAGATEPPTLTALWNELLNSVVETPALRTAMASAHALGLLARSGITPAELAARLRDRPFLVGLLSPQTFRTMTQTLPAGVTLRLIAAAPDEQWDRLRTGWLDNLREGIGLADLWTSLEAALGEAEESERLARRLLADPEVAETILGVDDPAALLQIREPAFGPLLGRYVRAHEERFGRGSSLLLDAATHVLPDVREWALARVAAVGMDLPFALRLLESEIPPSAAVGRTFFDNLPPGDARELGHALALCDSPRPSVRAYGREFVLSRWATLPRAALYQALFENPAPEMQAFVADRLRDEPAPPEGTAEFDRDVLRARRRGRRAKEQVKARQTVEPTVDADTLLALARGTGTPRDAEWALGQLARRALAGETVEGVTVDGPAGG